MSDWRPYAALAVALFVALLLATGVVPGVWGGADGAAAERIRGTAPDYEPWYSPLWTPPSDEIESLLFALQAGVGGLGIGYYLGRTGGPTDDGTTCTDVSGET